MQRYRLPLRREVPIPSNEEATLPQPIAYYYLASEVDARIVELEKALREAKRSHSACDDPWYSCPMHEDGCSDSSREKDECTCGAEEHNAKIDRSLMVRESL